MGCAISIRALRDSRIRWPIGRRWALGVPIDEWLRGPLRDWAEALLVPARLAREAHFHASPAQQKREEHQAARRNWSYRLRPAPVFQAWQEERRVTTQLDHAVQCAFGRNE